MKKNIVLLGSNNNIGLEAIKYFKEYTNKFLIYGISYDSKENNLNVFILQIKELKPEIVFLNNKEEYDYILSKEDFSNDVSFFIGDEKFIDFIKFVEIDEIVSALSGISSIKKILSSIYEFKDVTLLNTSPILYSGKIIVNEAKSKGVSLKIFSYPLYSLDFLSRSNNLKYIYKINLFSQKRNKDFKINVYNFKDSQSYLKKFYSQNKIRIVNDMFLINYLYDIPYNKFNFYNQSKKIVNIDVKYNNGTSLVFAANLNLKSIFNYYYLNSEDILEKDLLKDKETLSVSFSKIDLKNEKFVDLGLSVLCKGGSLPIVYYITIETLLDLIYFKKIKEKINFYSVLKEFVEDKSLYSKYPDLGSIYSIEKKIYNKILKNYSLKS